ncbi:MAG: hypothetical protein AAGE37_04925 [Pseudomonadota bacterium]
MQFVLKNILHFMPLIFGLGFLGPLCAQILSLTGWADMAGISALAIGIAIGGSWGLIAQLRGRWI